MAYGLTPYDKESYKQSKKRRRQALKAEKTGRITPIVTAKRKVPVFVCIALGVLLVAGAFFAVSYFSNIKADETKQLEEVKNDDEILLMVVKKQTPLDEDYVPDTVSVQGIPVGTLAAESLGKMISDAEKDGISLNLNSGYISYQEQQTLYEQKLSEYLNNPDYTTVRAEAAAQKEVPVGGESEAQTGLLVEFDTGNKETLNWLEKNCVNYGFIKRYPQGKEDLTSRQASDSLYRYVSEDYAIKMRSLDMCLDEFSQYIALQKSGK